VAFYPNILAVVPIPVAFNPVSVRVRRLDVVAGNPDVVVALPAVITGMPGPVAMLGRRGRRNLVRTLGRTDGDVDLSSGASSSHG
jgi:hypothetical protein